MKKHFSFLILCFAAVCGEASAQQPVGKNNQELVRLQQQSEARVKNQQKQLSPYDANSREGSEPDVARLQGCVKVQDY